MKRLQEWLKERGKNRPSSPEGGYLRKVKKRNPPVSADSAADVPFPRKDLPTGSHHPTQRHHWERAERIERQSSRRAVKRAVCLLLSLACFSYAGWLVVRFQAAVPAAVEVYGETGVGLPVSERPFALAAETEAAVNGVTVTALVTNSAYGSAAGLRFVDGAYFLPQAVEQQRAYAVIPDALALELFGTTRAAGLELTVTAGGAAAAGSSAEQNGQTLYLVCGVYQTSSRFLDAVSRTAKAVVYCSRAAGDRAAPAATAALLGGAQEPVERLLETAAASCGRSLSGIVRDLRAFRQLNCAVLYAALCCCLCRGLLWLLRRGASMISAAYERWSSRAYPSNGTPVQMLAAALLLILAACGLLSALLNGVTIPQAFLPADRIFDLGFYGESIVRFFQETNGMHRAVGYEPMILSYSAAIFTLCGNGVILFWLV